MAGKEPTIKMGQRYQEVERALAEMYMHAQHDGEPIFANTEWVDDGQTFMLVSDQKGPLLRIEISIIAMRDLYLEEDEGDEPEPTE